MRSRSLMDEYLVLNRLLMRAYDRMRAVEYRKAFNGQVTPAYGEVLEKIHCGVVRHDYISIALEMTHVHIGRLIKDLAKHHYVTVGVDKYDDRCKVSHLTPTGKKLMLQCRKVDLYVRWRFFTEERKRWERLHGFHDTMEEERLKQFKRRPHNPAERFEVKDPTHPIRAKFQSDRGASIKAWNRARMESKSSPGIDLGDLEPEGEEDGDVDQG